ncbi:YggS family pyridoxal phosphate-dependent enzyme [Dysgonomonas sp. OttesenSCG-928-M03]|nr:YggS family pyridoxal phosphate-dependent enzyme [Dysgonomonas sp. OttesenSCG-928-M03]
MDLRANLKNIKSTIPPHVKLVAVSKFHHKEALAEIYDAGQKIFGESRVQELSAKQAQLPDDIEWHLIGHLQTNKIKTIAPYIHTIESVDSWKLLVEIDKYASRAKRKINCLLEIHIAREDSKFGFTFDTCRQMLENKDWHSLEYINIAGVMGMATYSNDENLIREEFRSLKNFYEELKNKYFSDSPHFKEISMGMSHDYKIAIEEGSTIVRIGTSIFGEREF